MVLYIARAILLCSILFVKTFCYGNVLHGKRCIAGTRFCDLCIGDYDHTYTVSTLWGIGVTAIRTPTPPGSLQQHNSDTAALKATHNANLGEFRQSSLPPLIQT